MAHFYRYILSLLLACLMAMPAYGVIVRGQVTGADNEPLEFVTVKVKGSAAFAVSGLDGKYQLNVADADTLRLSYKCVGYEESNRRLIGAKGEVTLNVKMSPKTFSLRGVEVTEIRKQTGQLQDVDINSYRLGPGVHGGSVEDMLTTLGGVAGANELSSQYSVRGGSYDENSVYINGMEVYRPQLVTSGQQEGLSIINPDMVENVRFSTGGFPAQYGDRMSSALDIVYREPEEFELSLGASLMGANATLGVNAGKLSMLHGVRYQSNSSLLNTTEEKGEYQPRYFDYQTSMAWHCSKKFKVSFVGNISLNNYKFIPASRSTSFGTVDDAKQFKVYFDGQEKDKFHTYFGALNFTFSPSRVHSYNLMLSAFQNDELVTYDISGEYWLDQAGSSEVGGELGVGRYHEHARNRLKSTVMTAQLRGALGINHHTLGYGVQFSHEKMHDRSREWEMHDSVGHSLPLDPDKLNVKYTLTSKQDIESSRMAAWVQDAYRLDTDAGYLSVLGGVRLSYWDYNKEWLVSPRINVGFVPARAPRWAFRFATGLYYQAPFFKEYRMPVEDSQGNTVIVLNDQIRSQRSYQLIGGADFTFRAWGRPFKLSGEAYYKILGNLIPYEVDNLKLVYTGVNQCKGSAAGVDFKLFGQFVPGSDSWLSFSLMQTRETLDGKSVPRPSDRRYNLALFFTDYFPKIPRLLFSLRGILCDGLPTTAPHTTRYDGYFRAPAYKRVDIGLNYIVVPPRESGHARSRFIKSLTVGLDVFNLFDMQNVSSYYWVTDVNDIQYAVPNYLTGRQINVKIQIKI